MRIDPSSIRPLRNKVLVRIDANIPTLIPGLIAPIKTDAWRGRDNAIESYGRGVVVSAGPGARDSDTGKHIPMLFEAAGSSIRSLQPGDVVRFSELEYPTYSDGMHQYAMITDGDVVGVEQSIGAA